MPVDLAATAAARTRVAAFDSEPLEPIRSLLQPVGLTPSDATLWRWIKKGRNGVKLRIVRVGRLMSKRSWVTDFVASLTENAETLSVATPKLATPKQLADRLARAQAELDAD